MASAKEWEQSGAFFPFQNHSIFFKKETSEKECLLLIHGYPTSSFDFHLVWEELKKEFSVFTIDMIGFGFSDKPFSFPYSVSAQADCFEEFFQTQNLKKFHILAHDYGVTIAQELLARYDEQKNNPKYEILSVCFLNGGLFPETHKARPIQKLLMSPIGFMISKLSSQKTFQKTFSEVFGPNTKPTLEELQVYWEIICRKKGHYILYKHIRYIEERKRFRSRWVGILQKTSVPIFLINGPKDPVSGIHMTKRYQELIPNPKVFLLGDSIGHYPQVEDPKGVLQYFLGFHS